MKVFLFLLRQELREKRFYFLGVAAAGLLFVGWALARSPFHSKLTEPATTLAFFIVYGVTLLMGGSWLVLGFGAGGRRGFELTRPVSAAQLGAAKLGTILLMAAAGGFLAALPDLLGALGLLQEESGLAFGPSSSHGLVLERLDAWGRESWLWIVADKTLLVLFLLVLVQTVVLPIAARQARSLLTLGALVLLGMASSWVAGRLGQHGVQGVAIAAMPLALAAISGLGLYAAWRSFASGLLADAHRAYSRPMSAGLLILAAVLWAGSVAATRADFTALTEFSEAAAGPDGMNWLLGGDQQPPLPIRLLAGGEPLRSPTRLHPRFLADTQSRSTNWLGDSPQEPEVAAISAPLAGGGALLVEVFRYEVVVRRLPERDEAGRLTRTFTSLSGNSFRLLLFRAGSHFDLVTVDPGRTPRHEWQVQRFRLDAAMPELKEAGSWRLPAGDREAPRSAGYWAALLALLDAGLAPEEVVRYQDLVPLAGGTFLALPADPRQGGWRFLDPRGIALHPFPLPPEARPAGEIRPGLLLATLPGTVPEEAWNGCRQPAGDVFTTLVVETSSGRILRRLPGFAAKANCTGDGQVWLVGPQGEPYDLGSADAEPRRILPWRPRGAAGKGEE